MTCAETALKVKSMVEMLVPVKGGRLHITPEKATYINGI